MFDSNNKVKLLPKIAISLDKTMVLFAVLDFLPCIIFMFHFLLLFAFNLYIQLKFKRKFSDVIFMNYGSIRIFSFLITLIFLFLYLFYEVIVLEKVYQTSSYLIYLGDTLYMIFNLFFSLQFKKTLKNFHKIEGFLEDDLNSLDNYN